MSSDWVVRCAGVGKAFQIYKNYNDRMRQVLFGRVRKYYKEFWVLRDIDLEIAKGDCLGIIGRNGAGKTTLLQLICGITQPTYGTVNTRGSIAPVLALGAGFDTELTGRENVLIGGAILGMRRQFIIDRLDSIADFAGIGEFLDRPVKFYSSGMYSRLAFAICAHADADILIIDEVLAVGDEAFQTKCLKFIEDYRQRGTILFVSHGLPPGLCSRAIWIDRGYIRAAGDPQTVADQYHKALTTEKDDAERFHIGN
jgi:homopolymeric O-antigen transport system ATP-binding protein